MIIGAKIAACRKRAGMSQEKLANELNISRQAVSRWETGEAVPDTEKAAANGDGARDAPSDFSSGCTESPQAG